jgi:hypothetical protein
MRRVVVAVLAFTMVMGVAAPAAPQEPDEGPAAGAADAGHDAVDASGPPTLSVEDRLADRRYVAIGDRAYVVGTQDGRFPAMGFHTRGEMGGFWSGAIKLLDGLWFGIDGEWVGPAERFTSGYGHVALDLPGREGLSVRRTEFAPDGHRAVLVGLELTAADAAQSLTLDVDAHSELMGIYPWGETNPSQLDFNLQDAVAAERGRLAFTEQGTPPVPNALPHDWAAVVGSTLEPARTGTGDDYRGPQEPPVICPASGPDAPPQPPRCDDTAYGRGAGGRLSYQVEVPAGGSTTVWFAVAGSEAGAAEAHATADAVLADPQALLDAKVADREALAARTRLDLPGDPDLAEAIDWSKQNLADSVQVVEDLELRETNAGKNYPPPEGELERIRFLGAGFPDYPWLFATDGEYTAFASVAVGQFEPIKDHLRALRDASLIDNQGSGKVVHEVIQDGSVFFGSNADPGNTDETAKFPSAVALIWRWTGDDAWLDEMYDFSKSNMDYIFRELDDDGDGWPEGLGNVEREGMGPEKLDNTVYTIRGLWDLADMARAQRDWATAARASARAADLQSRFSDAWWMPEIPQHADSLGEDDEKIQQRHWIGATPMEVELQPPAGRARGGLATREQGQAALALRETECYGDEYGMFHTGREGCDPAESEVPDEENIYTLNTSIIAVAEGNYGRMGEDQQQRWTTANARLQLEPDEQPGAMPEIAPSPDYSPGGSIDRLFTERAMVLQAWGAYGTVWPVVHQQLGVRPHLGRGQLEVVPQVPEGQPGLSGEAIAIGGGEVAVAVTRDGGEHTVTARLDGATGVRSLTLGHVLPADAAVGEVLLDGEAARYQTRSTNRGLEVLVRAPARGEHTLTVTTR